MIFIFPKGNHTDWERVRAEVNKWQPVPLLIDEYRSGRLHFRRSMAIMPGSAPAPKDGPPMVVTGASII